MKIINDVDSMKIYVRSLNAKGETICLVPTMGYLHEGHLSLMREGRKSADHLFVSIFVNPTQFGPNEDLDKYPRDLERDVSLAESVGVDCIFFPNALQMYPDGYATYINVEGITEVLCGASRPTHFRGVTTVVAKLFNIMNPDYAVFGQKDYQQLAVIKRMVADLNMDVKIMEHPIIREEDGLAMSSRNKYLSPEQRENATILYRSLLHARDLVNKGIKDAARIKADVTEMISSAPGFSIDYAEIVDTLTLRGVDAIEDSAVLALAVKIGATRLIDNITL